MKNLLINKIYQLQDEYCELLETLINKLSESNSFAALDTIDVFWASNINIVELYLRNYATYLNSYMFTTATYIDIDNNEHLPFLLMGNTHIFDDPIFAFVQIVREYPQSNKVVDKLKKQIITTAKNNINIIKQINYNILVLPIRMCKLEEDGLFIRDMSEQLFISLFDEEISSMDKYREQCKTISDIENHLTKKAINILFMEEKGSSFQERYLNTLHKSSYLFENNTDDNLYFDYLVRRAFMQVVDILVVNVHFNIVPYLRNLETFRFLHMLSENFIGIPNYKETQMKVSIGFIARDSFDYDKMSNVNFEEYVLRTKEYLFSDRVLEKIDCLPIELSKIKIVVEKELEQFYNEFN